MAKLQTELEREAVAAGGGWPCRDMGSPIRVQPAAAGLPIYRHVG